ncbi:hypothetical protein COX27_01050 [Candidatus Kuenenbacteria bacterium CG23_combo_of_CG06-09_8_20_14_all_36_9]|uniref:O-antigen ligase-related domain-containing protein n=1 Tax=Candidatus Kuenenbacteria bacterium CG10_big_fil_rev_8_21_14_0_10_36_11 TaxID=1974618 RepID=A0A2M6WAU5_9BACT|nr:MAG: hypothetical protein COX27_01050 [Candidatus Kuenenbacteria bacterium CG23_combo_of_CG06-09_8_20_14_all_36_9]PIT89920.1 MAG: hypothetical protein COU23_01275 [Candidatus Kuenenbacteria bacterium CG10_big_fil_rev_8_21_14_0_10_36_11]
MYIIIQDMSQQKLAKYLSYALKTLLYLILLTPILISAKYLFPFITTKTMYFRLMIELALVLYTVLALMSDDYKPKMTKLSWSIVIFGFVILLTGITGVDFYRTFWGTIERGEGFITISHLIIYFLLLTWVFKSKKDWFNYLSVLIGVGVLVDFYAILQRANVENFFLFGRIIHPGEGRLSSTLGNAAFLGAFTLAQFFLSVLLFFKRDHWAWKMTFALTALLNILILFQTQTRGAGIALAIVLILISLFYGLKSSEKNKKITALTLFIFLIIAGLFIWLNKNSSFVQNNNMLRRLVSISKTDITTESRLAAWQTSWNGWKDRFIFGYGWENYNIAFNKYFPAIIYKDAGSQLWFDRAHNTIFDVAVATGLIGLINYLTIFGLALYYLFKNIKNDFDFSVILIAFLTAHFIQNIFVFDVLASYIILFTIFALISFTSKTADEKKSPANSKKNFNILILTAIILVVSFVSYILNFKPLSANKLGLKAMSMVNVNENETVQTFVKAINLNTYQTMELRQKLADNVLVSNRPKNGLTQFDVYNNYKTAINEIKKNINDHPNDVQNYLYLTALLNQAGGYDAKNYDEIIQWSEKALILSPTRPQIYFEMGQAKITQNKFAEGIGYFKKALTLNPDAQESHWNLFAAYVLTNNTKLAEEEYDWLNTNGFDFNVAQNLNRLYNIYLLANKKDKLVEVMEKMVTLDPSASNYAKLAAVYKEAGQISKARTAVLKAVELDPSLKTEAEKFLELLK